MACPVPTPCFLSSLSLLSLSTVHYHTRTEETSWKKATKKATVHLNLYRNKTATRTKKKKSPRVTDNEKIFFCTPTKRKIRIFPNYPFSHVAFYIFYSLLALLEGGSGDDSLYFLLCHYQPGNSVRRMMPTSCRE